MVAFNTGHKHEFVAAAGPNSLGDKLEWFNAAGTLEPINMKPMKNEEVWDLRNRIQNWCNLQLSIIDDELNDWESISCSVCGEEDLAYRGSPFITWGLRGGDILCPRHLVAYDRIGTPEDVLLKQARAEEAEIKELFG